MKNNYFKFFALLLFGLMLPAIWNGATGTGFIDDYSHILIKESMVQGAPKGNSIQATLDGHWLSVVFLENLGQVYIEISEVGGGEAQSQSTPTPNGVDFYITYTGSYIVTFTLPNGDEYYGEFEVRD